ncbi:MAG: hypothetical protein HUU16_05910 [Candidatus Omnitrophica bacterium]|nr:hypothetical protein [bacterium]NUN95688.1 hypothetical protein [Candidatus Omnitrophota bacterium]
MNRRKTKGDFLEFTKMAEAALQRAAKRAREIAYRNNRPVVYWKDGKVVEEWVKSPED